MEAKETIEDGSGRKCANSQFSNQNRQDALQSAGCWLCRIAREARGERNDGLAAETHGHINSAGCEGMATTFTAAHHSIRRHLYDSMHPTQKPKSKLKFVTLEIESNAEHAVATRRFSKNLQQGRSGGEGTGYRDGNTCQEKVKRLGTTSIKSLSS